MESSSKQLLFSKVCLKCSGIPGRCSDGVWSTWKANKMTIVEQVSVLHRTENNSFADMDLHLGLQIIKP